MKSEVFLPNLQKTAQKCAVSFYFLDEYRLNFIFVKFSTKNFLLLLYRTKSLKSNFLTPKSYSAPATVKFYTVSNFGRANKLQTSWEAGKLESSKFQKRKAGAPLFKNLFFLLIKFENFLILRYNIYRKSRKTKKIKRS